MLWLLTLLACGVTDSTEVPRSSADLAKHIQTQSKSPPPPTEHWLGEGAETRNKLSRKAWMNYIHKAPPGTDWKAIERRNGQVQILRRNELAAGLRSSQPFTWTERGSQNQAGRMHVVALSSDGEFLYGGSSKGGVWKGRPDGSDWQPIGDSLYAGAHWLTATPSDAGPDVLLAGSDWGQIYVSTDEGTTWTPPAGLPQLNEIRRLVRTVDGEHTVYLAAMTGGVSMLYRSDDGGQSFTQLRPLGPRRTDIWVARDGQLWVVAGRGLETSADGGASFSLISELPNANADRIQLTGSEAGAPRLYLALTEGRTSSLYRSDGGQQWQQIVSEMEDFWGPLVTSPSDPDVVAWGGVETWVSRTGGEPFEAVNGWGEYYGDPVNKLHADIMGFDVVVDDTGEERWYVNTDGGLYLSTDKLQNVQNLALDGLRISQYYDTLTSNEPPYDIHAGSQDQGYQITNTMNQPADVRYFEQALSGDYGHLESSDGTHNIVYSVYPGFILVTAGTEFPAMEYLDFPDGFNSAWIPPLVADPDDPAMFYLPGTRLWRYRYRENQGEWGIRQWSEQSFDESEYEYLSGMEFSPINHDKVYGVTDYGRLYHSEDRGVTWTKADDVGPGSNYLYGTAIVPSMLDEDVAYVGGSGYGSPAVLKTIDGGRSWQSYGEGLPETMVYSLCETIDGTGRLLAGTEFGVFMRSGDETEWIEMTQGKAPINLYWSCEALAHEPVIRFGTYGRGIWDLNLDPEGAHCWPPVDSDEDGSYCQLDCDDANPAVLPGAVEVCDGVDNDCNGEIDELDCAEPNPDPFDPVEGKGCGCETGPLTGSTGVFLLLGLFARRRR